MNLTSRKNIKNLLKKYQTYPSKRFGQNFLINNKVLNKIVDTANLKKNDTVLEIGPGIGTLTQELAKKSKESNCCGKRPKNDRNFKRNFKRFSEYQNN